MTASDRLAAALAGRYRIERELGQGGMATVYLAEDLKHDRKVAIKVLKPELAAVLGAERFVQEIKTTAALTHPHILPLFDSGEAGGFLYYVMPYLAGETIRDKLNRETQLGVDEAIRITTEVADALDHAHRHGVIHRDIKPENVLLYDGRAMVMDFGIALAVSAAAGGRMTETGLSLGTPHYMSPEQATADKDITARSDVYSLASVLYEMLTGNPPHVGASAQQIIMKIVTEEAAPVTTHRKSVPANVAAALAKALEKLPADRFESAKALSEALTNPAFRGNGETAVGAGVGRPARSPLTVGLALGAVLAAGIGAGWLLFHHPAPASPVVAATITADSTYRASNVCCGPSLAISRDGQTIAFYAEGSGESRIFVHRLDEFGSRPVPGTEGARSPFLSPDGRWLGFVQGGELTKLDLQGGSPVTLAPVPGAGGIRGADWTDQGQIYFGNADERRIYRVSVQGGAPEAVTPADTGWSAGLPQLLPGGRSLLFSRFRGTMGASEVEVDLLDLKSGEVRRLSGDQASVYSETGFLVSARLDGSLMAQRFDPRSGTLRGEPIRIGEGVIVHAPDPDAEFAVSATGSVVYRQGNQAETDLQEFSLDGAPIAVHLEKRWSMQPSYSPDGRQIAFAEAREDEASGVGALDRDTPTELWVLDLGSGIATQLSAGGRDWNPVWSADGRFVLWTRTDADSGVLMRRRADLSAGAEPFGPGVSGVLGMPARSPGPIPFTHVSRGKIDGLWLVGQDGSDPHPWRATYRGERSPAVSPSGRWIAYESSQSGRPEVYVEPFPAGGPVTQVSKAGGQAPVWATDERLLFLTPATALVGVDLDLRSERPRPTGYRDVVMAVAQNSTLGAHAMSVSANGQRVVLLRQSGAPVVLLEVNRLRHLAEEGAK